MSRIKQQDNSKLPKYTKLLKKLSEFEAYKTKIEQSKLVVFGDVDNDDVELFDDILVNDIAMIRKMVELENKIKEQDAIIDKFNKYILENPTKSELKSKSKATNVQ